MFTPPVQHSVSAVPAVITVGAVFAHLPEIISVLVGCAALFYYYLVIGNLLRERREKDVSKPQAKTD